MSAIPYSDDVLDPYHPLRRVLANEHVETGRTSQGGEDSAEDAVPGGLGVESGPHIWSQGFGDIEERRVGSGHLEAIAGDDGNRAGWL